MADVDKNDLWDLRDTILEEMRAGFRGVHERQDLTNGRVTDGAVQGATHDVKIRNIEAEVFGRRRVDDRHLPLVKPEGDDRSISQRDVRMVLAGAGGLASVVTFFWKLLPLIVRLVQP